MPPPRCRELIAKDGWRIGLVLFEEHGFQPGGFIHAACAGAHFETTDLLDRIRHFNPGLGEADLASLFRGGATTFSLIV